MVCLKGVSNDGKNMNILFCNHSYILEAFFRLFCIFELLVLICVYYFSEKVMNVVNGQKKFAAVGISVRALLFMCFVFFASDFIVLWQSPFNCCFRVRTKLTATQANDLWPISVGFILIIGECNIGLCHPLCNLE